MTIVVRTATPPLSLVPAIRGALHQIDKDQPMAKISTMEQLVANSVAGSRFTMLLLSAFAGLGLVLASIGIYGVTAYSVAQRTREIGIRMVLGGTKRSVLALIIGQGFKLTLLGVVIGIFVGLGLMRFLSSLLYGVKPTDALTFIGVSVLLAAVALLACYIPARRAITVDPMVAMRY
jgi:ABC-type antimicrobial peptide transport system permease subunit